MQEIYCIGGISFTCLLEIIQKKVSVPISFVAQIAQIIVISLGFGSIYYAIRKKESLFTLSVSKD